MTEEKLKLTEALKQAGLSPEKIDAWKKLKAQTTNTAPEQLEDIINRKEVSPKPAKMSQEGYINYLLSSIVTSISTGELVEITHPSIFPAKTIKEILSCELVCQANKGNQIFYLTMIGRGEKNVKKLEALDPEKTYQTKIGLVQKNGIKAWIGDDNTFTEVETSTHDEVQCPVLYLSDVDSNLSRFEPNSTFVVKTDIRKLTTLIMKVNFGEKWARLGIVDGTWIPTPEQLFFTAWVNPVVLRRVGTGEGSWIDIYGTLERDDKGRTYMNVCRIHPILTRALREPVPLNSDNVRVLNINV